MAIGDIFTVLTCEGKAAIIPLPIHRGTAIYTIVIGVLLLKPISSDSKSLIGIWSFYGPPARLTGLRGGGRRVRDPIPDNRGSGPTAGDLPRCMHPVDFRVQSLAAMSAVQRSMVAVRRIFFCNIRMPYISASQLGGHPGT
jgi:hypothetical protein